MERGSGGLFEGTFPGTCLTGLSKRTENLSQASRSHKFELAQYGSKL
jgi:hypothetical protein